MKANIAFSTVSAEQYIHGHLPLWSYRIREKFGDDYDIIDVAVNVFFDQKPFVTLTSRNGTCWSVTKGQKSTVIECMEVDTNKVLEIEN